jgi:hypothetical protein
LSENFIIQTIRLEGYKKSLKIPKGGNQNHLYIEEQTTQWSKEKVQKDKQRSTKHTQKAYKIVISPIDID